MQNKILSGRRAHYIYENSKNSGFYGISLASFCQSMAVFVAVFVTFYGDVRQLKKCMPVCGGTVEVI